ncbi:PEP-CTERM sorting domain-containing protein [Novosphingobium sp. Chol11]|nr:PEP-CTERM sorting domain-containing protein [Novosphingobium sp. Chol11]
MPEPSMVLLFGAAAAGLVIRRRQGMKTPPAA